MKQAGIWKSKKLFRYVYFEAFQICGNNMIFTKTESVPN